MVSYVIKHFLISYQTSDVYLTSFCFKISVQIVSQIFTKDFLHVQAVKIYLKQISWLWDWLFPPSEDSRNCLCDVDPMGYIWLQIKNQMSALDSNPSHAKVTADKIIYNKIQVE